MTMDVETRLALLENETRRIEHDHLELRDSISDLAEAVRELNQWQNKIDVPVRAAGFFFIGLLSAAGYGLWSLITSRL